MPHDDALPAAPVPVPRLTSRRGVLWTASTVMTVLALGIYVSVMQPENRWAVLTFAALFSGFLGYLAGRRTWLEPSTGTVVLRTPLGSRRVPLAEAEPLLLVPNRAGALLLRVRPRDRRPAVYVSVLTLTDDVQRSQDPGLCRLLADLAERFAPEPGTVPTQLRAQAEHLEAGGDAKDSPLAPLVTNTATRLARGGGAAGSGGSLLG